LEAQLAGLAQFGNARFSRVWHEIEALISHGLWQKYLGLCAIWTRSSRIGRNLKVQPGLRTICKRARFSRVGQNLQALRGLGTMWTRSSRAEHNLDVPASRGLGTIWK